MDPPLRHLTLTCLSPLDLIVSKLRRADEQDLADIRFLIELHSDEVSASLDEVVVPEEFRDVYPTNRRKVEALLSSEA